MTDLPQGADLAAHCLVATCVVEELERPLLAFEVVAHAVDLRETAAPEYVENLEAVVDDIADCVFSGLRPVCRLQLCRVGLVRPSHAPPRPRGGSLGRAAVKVLLLFTGL